MGSPVSHIQLNAEIKNRQTPFLGGYQAFEAKKPCGCKFFTNFTVVLLLVASDIASAFCPNLYPFRTRKSLSNWRAITQILLNPFPNHPAHGSNSSTAAMTRSCSWSVSWGYKGSDRISVAILSVTGSRGLEGPSLEL